MNNWINRLAIFAVVGAILSSAVLVGCGGNNADEDTTGNGMTNNVTNSTAMADENSTG